MLCSFLSGYLADIFGRRRLLLLAMLIYVVVGVGPFFLDSWIPVAICRIGVGACEGVVLTVTTAMLGDYFKGEQRDRLMGLQAAIASGSATVLIWISGLLGARYGWQGPFLIYGTSLVWVAGVWLFTWEPRPDERAGEHAGSASWAGFPWHLMLPIVLVTIFGAYCFYTTQFETPNALGHFGITDPARIGLLCGPVISSGMLIGAVAFQFVVRRGLNVLLPAALRFLPFEHRGRGTGIFQGTFASGQFVIGMSFPLVTALTGGQIGRAFVAVGICGLLAAAITLFIALWPPRQLAVGR
jgi:MFS family permease